MMGMEGRIQGTIRSKFDERNSHRVWLTIKFGRVNVHIPIIMPRGLTKNRIQQFTRGTTSNVIAQGCELVGMFFWM